MTTQEKKDFILSRRNWLRTKTGRWALRKATGLALRDSFRHAGVWYIPERAVRLTGPDAAGATQCVAAADKTRARLLATI